jgi:hypothetical protein
MMDVSRLQAQLLRTKLQNKDNPLYQLLNQLITGLKETDNQVLTVANAYPSALVYTPGSALFAGVTGLITENNSQFYWDDTNHRLGIGTNTPVNTLDVHGGIVATGPYNGVIGTAGTEYLFAYNTTAGATTFLAKTDGSVFITGIASFPTNVGLTITAPAGGNWTPLLVNSSASAPWFVVNKQGRTGIGTSTPEADLAVHGATFLGFIDSPVDNIVEIRSLGGGFAFKNASASLQYGALIGGGTSGLSSLTGGIRIATSVGDGLILQENGGNIFTGAPIKFGGNTASFPMFTRSSDELHCKLADNSAFATFRAEKLFANQGGGGAVSGAIYIGPLAGAAQFGGIWFGQATPNASNYAFLGSSTGVGTTLFNCGATGDIEMRVNNNARLSIAQPGVSINETSAVLPTIPLTVKDLAKTTTLLTLADNGKLSILANVVNIKNYTVATLPAGVRGDIAYVTDATAPAFLTALVGGGAVVSPAFYNGTTWVAF